MPHTNFSVLEAIFRQSMFRERLKQSASSVMNHLSLQKIAPRRGTCPRLRMEHEGAAAPSNFPGRALACVYQPPPPAKPDAGGFLCARPCKRNVYLLNGGKAGIIKQMGFCPRHAVHGERAEGGRTGRRVKSGLARGVRMVSPGDVYGSARVRENNPIASVSSPVCGGID